MLYTLFSKRLTAVQNYKGVKHLCARNMELFSKGLTVCKVLLKRYRNLWKEDRRRQKWNSLSNHFNQLWYSLNKVLAQVCAKPPSQGSEPFHGKPCNSEKKCYEVESLDVCNSFLKDTCHGCMHAICPSI